MKNKFDVKFRVLQGGLCDTLEVMAKNMDSMNKVIDDLKERVFILELRQKTRDWDDNLEARAGATEEEYKRDKYGQ